MTAKEYLMQDRSLDFKIKQRRQQAKELKQAAQSISSPSTGERVQASQTGGALEKAVEKYIGLLETAELEAASFQEVRNEITRRIEKSDDFRFIQVLTYRYINHMKFEEIACKMNYSFRQVLRLHKLALADFADKNKDVIECHVQE